MPSPPKRTKHHKGVKNPRRQYDLQIPKSNAKPRITLSQLARLTPKEIQKRGSECNVVPIDLSVDLNDVGAYKLLRATVLHNTIVHAASVMIYHNSGKLPDDPAALKKLLQIPHGPQMWGYPCWVSCDCEYWLYNCEVAVHRFQGTDIIYSNGEYPTETNSQLTPMLCVTGDTWVETDHGVIAARDCPQYLKMLTTQGMRTATMQIIGQRPIVRLTTQRGYSLDTLAEKEVRIVTPELALVWKRVVNLNPGDTICIARRGFQFGEMENHLSITQARVLGYMVAEGFGGFFANTDSEIINDFCRCCDDLKYEYRHTDGGVRLCALALSELERLGWNPRWVAGQKRVPATIRNAPIDILQEFIGAYWEGDGHAAVESSATTLTAGSKSRLLAREIQLLLLRLGIFSAVTINKNSGANHITMRLLRVTGNNARLFVEQIPTVRSWRTQRFSRISEVTPKGSPKEDKILLPEGFLSDMLGCVPRGNPCSAIPIGDPLDGELIGHDVVQRILASTASTTHRLPTPGGGAPQRAYLLDEVMESVRSHPRCLWCNSTILGDFRIHVAREHGFERYLRRFDIGAYRARKVLGFPDAHALHNTTQISLSDLLEVSRALRHIDPVLNARVEALASLGCSFDQVSSVRTLRKQRLVYNFEVSTNEEYFANGILVHNCKHLYAIAPLAVTIAQEPSGVSPTRKNTLKHPIHRGRLPTHIREHLKSRDHVPTNEEVAQAIKNVRDFL